MWTQVIIERGMATQSSDVSIASHRSKGQNNSCSIKGGTNQVCKWRPRQADRETQIVARCTWAHGSWGLWRTRKSINELRVPLLLKRSRVNECFGSSDRQDQQRATRDMIHLNVRTNQDAWGARMQRKNSMKFYPIYLDDTTVYTRKLVEPSHLDTVHRGVTLT